MGIETTLGDTESWVWLIAFVVRPTIMMDLRVRCVKEVMSLLTGAMPAALLWRSATALGTMGSVTCSLSVTPAEAGVQSARETLAEKYIVNHTEDGFPRARE